MAKKYLSLEEAAQSLGISTSEMNRLREKGEIRGFADRGTWKFKDDDVFELRRSRQADSSPDVPLMDSGVNLDEPGEKTDEGGSSTVLGEAEEGSSVLAGDVEAGSSVVLGGEGEDALGEEATVVRKSALDEETAAGPSDSDVRLILDESLTAEEADSDSDVRLVEEAEKSKEDSDSDVKLVEADSDSDVKLVEADSDSDVRLAGDTDSDARLTDDSDSDVRLAPDAESDVRLMDDSDSDVRLIGDTDSDVPLAGPDSGTPSAKETADRSVPTAEEKKPDSGITLEGPADSGIALEADSGITVAEADDSGIALAEADDSGIALEGEEDSGISLGAPSDSGIALEALTGRGRRDDMEGTVPMMESPPPGEDVGETAVEVPAYDEESGYELGESEDDTNVILFEDEQEVDERGATVVRKRGEQEEFDVSSGTFDFESEEFGDLEEELAEEVVGEDDELDDLDFVDAADEDFDETFQTGESRAEFVAGPEGAVVVAPVQQEWGTGTFVGLVLASLLMVVCTVVMYDFVRSMWSWSQPTSVSSAILDTVGGLFGK